MGSQHFNLPAQKPGAEGVEGVQPDIFRRRAYHGVHPVTHLFGRFVGKGDRQDFIGRHPQFQQVSNAAGQHLGLSAARPCQNQHRPVNMFHRSLLLRVQVCKSIHQSSKIYVKIKRL